MKIMYQESFDSAIFHHTPLYANSLVRRENKPILIQEIVQSNLVTCDDIWDYEQNDFCNIDEIRNKHGNVISVMNYNSLLTSIPTIWKQLARHIDKEEVPDSQIDILLKDPTPSQTLYWRLVEKLHLQPDASPLLWAKDLGINATDLDETWPKLIMINRKNTNASDLRWLQYKIMNRILTTNLTRSRWDNNCSKLCTFCQAEMETMLHLLFACKEVQSLWTSLEKWLKYFYKVEIKFTAEIVILNNYKGPRNSLINTFILILKHYLYAAKCKQESLKFSAFIARIEYWYKMEKITAYEKGNYHKCINKWKNNHF